MDLEKHVVHYLVLFFGLAFFGFLFIYFRFVTDIQTVIAGLASVFYVLWGIIHHVLEDRINKAVVLEYILIGSVAFLIVYTALNL